MIIFITFSPQVQEHQLEAQGLQFQEKVWFFERSQGEWKALLGWFVVVNPDSAWSSCYRASMTVDNFNRTMNMWRCTIDVCSEINMKCLSKRWAKGFQ